MSTKARNSGGCWTCRLRRKKCDEARPVCHDCAALEIDCLYSDDKPEWMDGAEKQRLRAERLKKEVKRRATHRRERRYLQGLEVRLESLDASLTDDSDTMAAKDLINTTLASVPTTGFSSTQAGAQGSTPTSASESAVTDTSVSAPSPDESSDGFPLPGLDLEKTLSKEAETHWTMMYLDYVFPFLFPFYRPSFVDKGRGWLLVLLTKNKALYHAALSLAGYISGIVLRHIQDAAPMCQSHTLETLHTQQGLALQWLQREMKDICTRGVGNNLAEANHVLASIIQLMACEVAVAKPGNWTMHLSAATELFNQMMTHHALRDGAGLCFMLLLLRLGTRPFTWTPRNHPWGSDQSILRFFTAQLLFLDTLASTALEQPPRLQQWHQHLLLKPDEETMKDWPASEKERTMPHIDLQEFVGVQNWVVLSIGEIAALDSWKKEMGKEGSLSVTQLATRAAAIEERLRTSLQGLQDAQINQSSRTPGDGAQHLMQYFGGSAWNRAMHGILLNTRIWAQAALTYLSVVLSGWQPSSPEIRQSVAQTVELLSSLPSPDCLRTLVWPFTVSGCLAAPDQERVFRDLVAGMGPLKVFGTIRDGFAIMEKVWERREEIDQNPDQWDLAACFNCLCRPALLI